MTEATQWPAASLDDIRKVLCAPGARFEMETVDVLGVPTRVWKNVLPNLRDLANHARVHGDSIFTIYEDERISFEAWYRATAALSETFLEMGVKKGDRIALAMRNLPEWPVIYFAATSIGAIIVPRGPLGPVRMLGQSRTKHLEGKEDRDEGGVLHWT